MTDAHPSESLSKARFVELQRERHCVGKRGYERIGPNRVVPITRSLPYFRTKFGAYVHRPRYGMHFFRDGQYSHTAVGFWCGGGGFAGSSKRMGAEFLAEPTEHSVLCATCEGRAIGAGLTDSRTIAGRPVMFSPRI